MSYTVHTIDTAKEAAKETLSGVQKSFGFIPNMLAIMAGAPPVLKAYLTAGALFDETSFSATERQVVMLTTSYENDCEYCVGAHTAISGMQKVPGEIVQAIRAGTPIADRKLEALRRFTSAVVTSRGKPPHNEVTEFHQAGYSQDQALEVAFGVGFKTIANYANKIAATPLDGGFAKVAWTKAA